MKKSGKKQTHPHPLWLAPLISISVWGCIAPGTGTGSFSNTSGANALGIASGPKAAKVIFTTNTTFGSFSTPPVGGTLPAVGSGLQAIQLFNPDNSLLAANNTSANWPAWLNSVEIGISGSHNTSATDPYCATFATLSPTCNFGVANPAVPCEAPVGTFRVSEFDCGFGAPASVIPPGMAPNGTATLNGIGGPNDGVYVRANFNRANLGPTENIMVVIEYAAAAYDAAPANPQTCFGPSTGPNGFTPEACSDFTWKMFMKHSPSEVVQPFMMLVPPTYSFVNGNSSNSGGTTSSTRQFIVPIAADAGLNTIQLSRIASTLNSSTNAGYIAACDGASAAGTGANSPLCAGLVIYSITFFRI